MNQKMNLLLAALLSLAIPGLGGAGFVHATPTPPPRIELGDIGICQLGETREAILERYGIPVEGIDLPAGATSELILFGGGTARVLFIDGIAEEIVYHRGGSRADFPISDESLFNLAEHNSLGSEWNEIQPKTFWILKNGRATMNYGEREGCKHALSFTTIKALAYWKAMMDALSKPGTTPTPEKKKDVAPKDKLLTT